MKLTVAEEEEKDNISSFLYRMSDRRKDIYFLIMR